MCFFHTDSKVVLGYVTNTTRRFYIYVANRVCRILEFLDQTNWFYISTENNPADVGTRYIDPARLEESMWIQGLKPNISPTESLIFPSVTPEEDTEVRPEVVHVAKTDITNKLQREFYGDIRKCPKELSPYLDENGMIRVGGRLQNSDLPRHKVNPILVPGRHHVAMLLTRHFHNAVQHQGRHLTEGAIRAAGFWITGGKRLDSFVIHHCVKCRKLRGKHSQQKMADLPVDRITPSPPFTFVGVDVFGPWTIVTRRTRGGSASSKRWAVLFTCLSSRAVHIELLEEMSSSSFINSVRRFYAIRGKVAEFHSDSGTNFVGAISDLDTTAIFIKDPNIKEFLGESGTIWKFNPPHASHFGGSWERMIGVARRILDSMFLNNNRNLTHEVLSTFMAEVTAIINARPLIPVSTDVDKPLILSPATLLTQKTESRIESFEYFNQKDMLRSQWKHVQVLAEQFWSRWRKEFLPVLQARRKWNHESRNLEEGDVVLMKDEQTAHNDWPLGVITRTFPSEDGIVRKVEIQISREGKKPTFVRPVTQKKAVECHWNTNEYHWHSKYQWYASGIYPFSGIPVETSLVCHCPVPLSVAFQWNTSGGINASGN
ncbi:uncharacterized protein [Argopecten irradians]|uniref:uncharacterized protein n=1 Tax=Argopecten irradians TaxID=31199 RepID=UPI0037169C90